jgi:hypothetical protein
MSLEDGRTYVAAMGRPISAGGSLDIELTGLPHHSKVPRYLALFLALAIVGAGGWAAFGGGATQVQTDLSATREKLLSQLVQLEQERRSGNRDVTRLAARREELIRRLERLYGELDTAA